MRGPRIPASNTKYAELHIAGRNPVYREALLQSLVSLLTPDIDGALAKVRSCITRALGVDVTTPNGNNLSPMMSFTTPRGKTNMRPNLASSLIFTIASAVFWITLLWLDYASAAVKSVSPQTLTCTGAPRAAMQAN